MRASVPLCVFPSAPLRYLDKRGAYFGGFTLLVLSAALMSPIASAQSATSGLDTTGNFKSEVATCAERATPQARTICIGEARTAQAAKRAGKLDNHGGNFEANALRRCEVFKMADDRAACETRVKSAPIDGSVIEGGVLRESVVTVTIPGDAGTAPPPPNMPSMQPMPMPAPILMPSVPQ
ncbi:MAG: hypothetical protein NTZ64_05435 [Polaromonas sp.]|nr:hypothetical protein [Polaromonas sp.]